MSKVIVSPFVEDGVLKVNVIRIDHESGTVEALKPDGSWRPASIYERDHPDGAFNVPRGMNQGIVEGLSA